MGLKYVALDEKEMKGYVYTGSNSIARKNREIIGTHYSFINVNGYKPISIVKIQENKVGDVASRKNGLRSAIDKQKKMETLHFIAGDEVVFNNLILKPRRNQNGIVMSDIYAKDIKAINGRNINISLDGSNSYDMIRDSDNGSDYLNFVNVSDFPIDYDKTFGELIFLGVANYKYVRDSAGNLTDDIESIKYNVFSILQGTVFTVEIASNKDLKIELNSRVKLTGVFIENYNIDYNNVGFKVSADGIEKINNTNNTNNTNNVNNQNKEKDKTN